MGIKGMKYEEFGDNESLELLKETGGNVFLTTIDDVINWGKKKLIVASHICNKLLWH